MNNIKIFDYAMYYYCYYVVEDTREGGELGLHTCGGYSNNNNRHCVDCVVTQLDFRPPVADNVVHYIVIHFVVFL